MGDAWISGDGFPTGEISLRYGIPKDEVEAFIKTIRIYKKDTFLFCEENKERVMFLLRCGEIAIIDSDSEQARNNASIVPAVHFVGDELLSDYQKHHTKFRAFSPEVLVYALSGLQYIEILSNPQWGKYLISLLGNDLAIANTKMDKLQQDISTLQGLLQLKLQKMQGLQNHYIKQVKTVAKIFGTLLKLQEGVKNTVTVSSRAWYYLDTLDKQTMKLLSNYAPEIATYVKGADPEMLKACLQKGTDFLNPDIIDKLTSGKKTT